jgi:predicted dehydrogenase
VALIGFGLAGSAFHAPLIATTPGLRLASIVTRDPERQRQAAHAFPRARIVATAAESWAMRDIDVVVIATPNRTHVPLARAALADGLPVVVDKPLAATAAEARGLIDDFRARGVLLTVFQNRRWDGDFLTVRQLLQSKRIGEPLRFESRFERWRLQARQVWREHGAPEDAGGLLYDLGSHLIDQALLLFGPVTSVYAELDRRRAGVEVDDDSFVALGHKSGVRSHLFMSVLVADAGPRVRLLGTRGAYTKFGLDVQEASLRSGGTPADADWGREPQERWGRLTRGDGTEIIETVPGDYPAFYALLAQALATGGPPPVDPADAVRTLEIIEAAQRSDAERRAGR